MDFSGLRDDGDTLDLGVHVVDRGVHVCLQGLMNCIDGKENCVRTSRLQTTSDTVMFPIWSLCDVPDLVEVGPTV